MRYWAIVIAVAAVAAASIIAGRRLVHDSSTRREINALAAALDVFKDRFGEYPPDCSRQAEVDAFVSRAWPQYNGRGIVGMSPASALVFWLSELSENDADPFSLGGKRLNFFRFAPARIKLDREGHRVYLPPGGRHVPYWYLHHDTYDWALERRNFSLNRATPYCDAVGMWISPYGFQVIAPGPDERFGFPALGGPKALRGDENAAEDADNLVGVPGRDVL